MRHWEVVRFGMKCAYGCEIKHAEWAYMRGRYAVCEKHAAEMGIRRVVGDAPAPPEMSPIGAVADELKDATSIGAFLNRLRQIVGKA